MRRRGGEGRKGDGEGGGGGEGRGGIVERRWRGGGRDEEGREEEEGNGLVCKACGGMNINVLSPHQWCLRYVISNLFKIRMKKVWLLKNILKGHC